jgi:hypothetical protein
MFPFWLVSVFCFISILAAGTADPLLRGAQPEPSKSSSSLNNNDSTTKAFINKHGKSKSTTASATDPPPPAAVWTLPLHAVSGTHHVDLNVGEPISRRTLIVDTGSRLTAWVCHECHNCGRHANTPYSFKDSSTAIINTCGQCDWPDTSENACRATEPSHRLHNKHPKKAVAGDAELASQTRCGMRQKYTEGSSWTAHEVNDIVILPVHNHRQSQSWQSQSEQVSGTFDASNTTTTAVTTTAGKSAAITGITASPESDDTVMNAWQEDILETAIPFTFGCQDKVHELFRAQYADGIMGLEATNKSFVHQLYRAGRLPSPIFSLCLTPSAGYIGFGGAVTTTSSDTDDSSSSVAVALEPMQFTPLVTKDDGGWYAVKVVEFYMMTTSHSNTTKTHANQKVQVAARGSYEVKSFGDGKGTILDSGTTDTYLPQDVASSFEKAWLQITGLPVHNRAHRYTHDDFLNLPDLVLVFENEVEHAVPAAHYMEGLPWNYQLPATDGSKAAVAAWAGTRVLTSRVYVDEPGGAVLGLNAMMGHDILYDSAGRRIGFAKANCHGPANANAPTTTATATVKAPTASMI